jgi:hypothetical protein
MLLVSSEQATVECLVSGVRRLSSSSDTVWLGKCIKVHGVTFRSIVILRHASLLTQM